MAWGRNIGRAAAHSAVALAGAVGSRSASRSGACSAVSAGGTPFVRRALPWALGLDPGGVGTVTMDVLAGSTIAVWVADMNLNGSPPGAGPPYTVTITDSQGGTYVNKGYVTESADQDAMQAFVRTNVAAGSLTITCTYITNQWHGLMVAEIANVSATPTVTFIGSVTANPAYPSTDTISTGTAALGSTPALIVALAYNATDITTSAGHPSAGTGFTHVTTGWNWNGQETTSSNDVAELEYRYLTNPGTTGATFSPQSPGPNPENFPAIALAFQ